MQCASHGPLYDVSPGPAPASKCSTPTARLNRSAGAALVGFGVLGGAALRQAASLVARLQRAHASNTLGTDLGT